MPLFSLPSRSLVALCALQESVILYMMKQQWLVSRMLHNTQHVPFCSWLATTKCQCATFPMNMLFVCNQEKRLGDWGEGPYQAEKWK